jgi:S1-C subfamily serine protease
MRRNVLFMLCAGAVALPRVAAATDGAGGPAGPGRAGSADALARASAAVLGVRAMALDDARSAATLGRERQGSGVVIGSDGLVLTIGYLVLEAEQVELQPDDGRRLPARVLAYDLATGFGLLQSLVPLGLEPVPLGRSQAVALGEPLMFASGGDEGMVGVTRLASRRAFAGYWEYAIDGALFTTPPRPAHSGAGLFNARGELLGIGSLFVRDALGPGREAAPGNMFVPVDLLKPILGELRERGASRASTRAWMGLNCVERDGEVRVMRVNEDSPAEVAGLEPGDRIVRIDGKPVGGLAQLYQSLWSGGAPERAVTLEVLREGRPRDIVVQTVDRAKTLRRAEGV